MILDEATIQSAEHADLPLIMAELARLTALVTVRLVSPMQLAVKSEPESDTLLTAEQAAPLVGLTVKQLVRNRALPFRVKIGKHVRFSARGIKRWQRSRAGVGTTT